MNNNKKHEWLVKDHFKNPKYYESASPNKNICNDENSKFNSKNSKSLKQRIEDYVFSVWSTLRIFIFIISFVSIYFIPYQDQYKLPDVTKINLGDQHLNIELLQNYIRSHNYYAVYHIIKLKVTNKITNKELIQAFPEYQPINESVYQFLLLSERDRFIFTFVISLFISFLSKPILMMVADKTVVLFNKTKFLIPKLEPSNETKIMFEQLLGSIKNHPKATVLIVFLFFLLYLDENGLTIYTRYLKMAIEPGGISYIIDTMLNIIIAMFILGLIIVTVLRYILGLLKKSQDKT